MAVRQSDSGASAARPISYWRVAGLTLMRKDEVWAALSADPDKALPLVEAAAEIGIPEALVRLGRMQLAGEGAAKNEAAAFAQFARAAESGNADALNMLGRCFENGWGTAPDLARATACYARAAEAGLAWAQYNYAHMLLDGAGVARDRDAAFSWYLRAANQGHVRAMNLLGRCLEEGWGAPRDPAAARAWYRTSAIGGYFRGAYNYASMLASEGCAAGARLWFGRALATAPEPTRSNMERALKAGSLA